MGWEGSVFTLASHNLPPVLGTWIALQLGYHSCWQSVLLSQHQNLFAPTSLGMALTNLLLHFSGCHQKFPQALQSFTVLDCDYCDMTLWQSQPSR